MADDFENITTEIVETTITRGNRHRDPYPVTVGNIVGSFAFEIEPSDAANALVLVNQIKALAIQSKLRTWNPVVADTGCTAAVSINFQVHKDIKTEPEL